MDLEMQAHWVFAWPFWMYSSSRKVNMLMAAVVAVVIAMKDRNDSCVDIYSVLSASPLPPLLPSLHHANINVDEPNYD
jgi:hypothetical protein